MRVRDYELIIIFSPQADDERVKGVVDRVVRIVSDRGGAITKQDPWGIRRLAYPIKDFREGNYFLFQFKVDAQQATQVDNALRVSEDVIRHLLVAVT